MGMVDWESMDGASWHVSVPRMSCYESHIMYFASGVGNCGLRIDALPYSGGTLLHTRGTALPLRASCMKVRTTSINGILIEYWRHMKSELGS